MESPRIALAHRTPTAATVSADADRRHVTVLFADVSGFTTLSERLDPEEIRAFQNALFAKLAEAVARYDGFVEKFVGDAVMAVFGAPLVHEDDPERALRAALDMVEGSKALSQQWAARLGQPVKLHIGVHSGPVVAGSLGNAAGAAYAVTGDTVNTTARLLAAASGTVLVSAATHALTRHLFDFEPARELTLRGKSEPVIVHRLVGVLADPRPARGLASHGMTSPMIGRADERVQLLSAFDRMQRDRAQLVSVMGEAGTGKSRLIAEFVTQLEVDGRLARTAVRRAVCSSMGEPTYGVFSALFRESYQVDATNSLESPGRSWPPASRRWALALRSPKPSRQFSVTCLALKTWIATTSSPSSSSAKLALLLVRSLIGDFRRCRSFTLWRISIGRTRPR